MSDEGANNMCTLKSVFDEKLKELSAAASDRSVLLDGKKYDAIVREVTEAQAKKRRNESLTSKEYRRLKRYNVMQNGESIKLIEKNADETKIRYYCETEDLFDILNKAHIDVGHKRTRGKNFHTVYFFSTSRH
jgi:hypothetical protein